MDPLADAVIKPVVELVMGVVKRHWNFFFYYTKNVTDMRAKIDLLKDTAHDMKTIEEANVANNLMVPHHLPAWLAQVETICKEAGDVPTGGIGCFNMKTRYKAGKKSSDIIKKIGDLQDEKSKITWSDKQRPLGRVRSTGASTSKSVATATDDDGPQTGLKSRDLIFKEAMKSLDPNNKIQKIALCGMGGVGKTTMMVQMTEVAKDKKMFDWILKVVIGESKSLIDIQQTVAEYLGKPLQETVKETRAKSLLDRFEGISENGKKNILVVLDDLWKEVDLKDIGLSNPLPKGFKLLLTSREENVCTRMGVETSCIFKIAVLEESEAIKLFWEIGGRVSDGDIDHDLRKIGEDIVRKCGGLPMAIIIIASTLRDNSVTDVWVDALERLRNKDLPFVEIVFKTSYENLKDDDEKATFLLSGLFPDDYNIPIEDLLRYGWGLKLFKSSKTVSTARRRVNTCVINLIRSNLLIKSDDEGCVKMHDLVRDFVLTNFSNVKQASLVNSDDISERLTEESYERILLKCTGMREFPADFNHSNLALLKLLDGDELRTFPKDFYDRMEKLEVVAYDGILQPLLPQYSTTLRTLCLRSCRSVGDISFIGDLVNLEVLSFAFCGISKLPSAIGNLKKLKLLDLTECVDLCIDDGVFHKLEKLRELYMRAYDGKPIRFTEDSCEGLKMLSSKLIALDVEFFRSIIQPKNLSFEKLERFRISMGCQLEPSIYRDAAENTLKLVVSCKELLECKINELFEKAEVLDLSVNKMSSLEQISMHPSQCSFRNLRDLCVNKCADLTSIFTVNVASSLTKLERLEVSECRVLESLVQEGENSEAKVMKFHKLKVLELEGLPMFVSLCDTDQVMELPQLVELELSDLPNVTGIFSGNNEICGTRQPLLNKKIVIPNLEILYIYGMEKLKEIWPCENTTTITHEDVNNFSKLRVIDVRYCDSVVNIFPCNGMRMRLVSDLAVKNGEKQQPLSLFHNLTTINLEKCKSIKYLFSPLLATHLSNLKNIYIEYCDGMEEVVSNRDDNEDEQMTAPTTTTLFPHLDQLFLHSLPSLKHVGGTNNDINDQLKYSQVPVVCWSLCQYSRKIIVRHCPTMSHVIPSQVAGQILMVERLKIDGCISMKEVFASADINNSGGLSSNFEERSGGTDTALAIPRLASITAHKLSNLKTMDILNCDSLEHIFTFSTLESLTELSVFKCPVLEFLVQEGENSEAKVIKFHKLKRLELAYLPMFVSLCDTDQVMELPQLVELELSDLPNVRRIFSGNNEICGTREALFSKKIVIPNLEKLKIISMEKLKEIWSCENTNTITEEDVNNFSNLREIEVRWCDSVVNIFPCNGMRMRLVSDLAVKNGEKQQIPCWNDFLILQNQLPLSLFPNLTTIHLWSCKSIKNLFSPLLATHLSNLKSIYIIDCDGMEEVVSNRDDNEDEQMTAPTTTTLFPHLDQLTLKYLPSLKHVGGGGVAKYSQVPVVCWSLCQYSREITIINCHAMSHVIPSHVAGQILMVERLKIDGCISMKEVFASADINNSGGLSSNFEERSGGTDTALAIPRLASITAHKLSNLKTMDISNCDSLEHIFTFSTLESLTELEEISIRRCKAMKVIVREENGEQTAASKAVVFPRLKSIILDDLPNLEGFFLGMSEFKWPLLDDVEIITCPKMMAFTSSKSTAPNLKYIRSRLGNYNPECCNFYVTTNSSQTPSLSLKNGPLSVSDIIEVNVEDNDKIEEIFASNELPQLQNLEKILVKRCRWVKTVFEVESEVTTDSELNNKSQTVVNFPKLREVDLEELQHLEYIWKSNIQGMKWEFPYLTRLSIHYCRSLRYLLTSSMVGSLMQLQDLHITDCYRMGVIIKDEEDEENTEEEVSIEDEEDEENTEEEVIVKDEEDEENTEEEVSIKDEKDEENTEEECDGDGKVSEIIVFPCLKSLKLERLRSLRGFYLKKDLDVSLPSLNTLVIKGCPHLEIFTKGCVAAPQLKVIETDVGLIDVGEQDINSFIITKKQEKGLHFAAEEWSDSDSEEY